MNTLWKMCDFVFAPIYKMCDNDGISDVSTFAFCFHLFVYTAIGAYIGTAVSWIDTVTPIHWVIWFPAYAIWGVVSYLRYDESRKAVIRRLTNEF